MPKDYRVWKYVVVLVATCPVIALLAYALYWVIKRYKLKLRYFVLPAVSVFLLIQSINKSFILNIGLKHKSILIDIFHSSSVIQGVYRYMFGFLSGGFLYLLAIVGIAALIACYVAKERQKNNAYSEELRAKVSGLNSPREEETRQDVVTPPQTIPNETIIGHVSNRVITVKDNARHVLVCGTTGSGKTVLLSNFIESGINKNYPMVIIDGKGDIGKGSLLDVLLKSNKGRQAYIVNLSDTAKSSRYNPFKGANTTVIKDMLISMSDWSEEHYKQNTERYLQRLTMILERMGISFSFQNLARYIRKDNLIELSIEAKKAGKLTKEEYSSTIDIIDDSGEIAEKASARFVTLAESELSKIFDEQGFDLQTAIEENAIVLFVLNPLLYPELSPRLAELVLIDLKKTISYLFTTPKHRTFFIFDEISSYMSTTFLDLVNKSRSANVTCILATQSLADLEFSAGAAFREQVIENCNNYIVLRQNSHTSAEMWANTMGTRESVKLTVQLENSDGEISTTDKMSMRDTREFLYHPDLIKSLKTGQAIYLSKDTGEHHKISVRRGTFI